MSTRTDQLRASEFERCLTTRLDGFQECLETMLDDPTFPDFGFVAIDDEDHLWWIPLAVHLVEAQIQVSRYIEANFGYEERHPRLRRGTALTPDILLARLEDGFTGMHLLHACLCWNGPEAYTIARQP